MTEIPIDNASPAQKARGLRIIAVLSAVIVLAVLSMSGLSLAAILGILGLLSLAMLLNRPEWAVFAVTFATFTNASFVLTGSLNFRFLTELLILLLAVIALLDRLAGRPLPRALPAAALVLGGYVASLAVSALIAPYPDLALEGAWRTARQVITVLALVIVVSDGRRLRWALSGVVAGVCMLAGLTVVQSVLGLQHINFLGFASSSLLHIAGEVDSWRITGPVTDPNYYGLILLTALPLVAERVVSAENVLIKALFALAVAAVLAAIVLTYSRGALVALMLVLLVAFWNSRLLLLGVAAVAVLIWGFVALLSDALSLGFLERLMIGLQDAMTAFTGDGQIQDRAVAGRLSQMLAAVILFLENPVFGVGYDQFEALYQDTAQIHGLMARGEDRQAHSLFLEILAERGIVGALIYGALVWFAIWSILRTKRLLVARGALKEARVGTALILCFVGYFSASIFLHEAFSGYFWLLVALAISFAQSGSSPFSLRASIPTTPFAKTGQDR